MSQKTPVLDGNRLYGLNEYEINEDFQTYTANLSDSTSLTDARILDTIDQALSDLLSIAESKTTTGTKPLSDATTLTETFTNTLSTYFNESTVLSDDEKATATKALAEAITLAETWTTSGTKPIADSLSLSETFAKTLSLAFADLVSLSLNENITATKVLGQGTLLPASRLYSEILYGQVSYGNPAVIPVDQLYLFDAKFLSGTKPLPETLTLAEIFAKTLYHQLSDAASISDAKLISTVKVILETLTLSETLAKTIILGTFSETLTLAQSFAIIFYRLLVDTLTILESRLLFTATKGLTEFILLKEWISVRLQKADPWQVKAATQRNIPVYGSILYDQSLYGFTPDVVWNKTPASLPCFINADGESHQG